METGYTGGEEYVKWIFPNSIRKVNFFVLKTLSA